MSKKKGGDSAIPPKLLYRQGDIVQLKGLKSKTHWNGKRAEIIGLFDESTKRWPIRLLRQPKKKGSGVATTSAAKPDAPSSQSSAEPTAVTVTAEESAVSTADTPSGTSIATDTSVSDEKQCTSAEQQPSTAESESTKPELPKALLKPTNMKLLRRGRHWTIDPINNDGQLLYMIMHAYTKDFNAFAQLTRRKKSIFHKDFTYRLHSGTVVTGLAEFDASLNRLKQQVSEMSDASTASTSKSGRIVGKIDPYFSDKTHVEVVDSDTMRTFKVVVVVDLRETEVTRLMLRKPDGTEVEVPTSGVKRKLHSSDSSFQSREWVRTTMVELKDGLVWKCTFLGYEIRYPLSNEESYTKPTSEDSSTEESKRDELSGIVSAIKQAKIANPDADEQAQSAEPAASEDSKSG